MQKILLSGMLLLLVIYTSVSAASKTTNITYGRWASLGEAKAFQALIDKFEKANPDVKVQAEFLPWNAYWHKLNTASANGIIYDVISFTHLNSAPYFSKNVLYDMGKLSGAKKLLSEMYPGTRASVIYKEAIYGMPVGVGVRAMIYNKAMFDEAGIPYPSSSKPLTWEEFVKIGKQLTKVDKDGKVTQYACNLNIDQLWEACVVQAGGSLVDNYTRPTKVTINTPEGIAGLRYLTELFKNDINVPATEQWNGPWGSPDSALNTKKVAIVQTGPWSIPAMLDSELNIGSAPAFAGKNRATFGYVNFLAISKQSKNIAAAWKFIKWLASPEGQLEFAKTGDLPSNSRVLEEAKKNPVHYSSEIMDAFYNELPYVITGPMLPTTEFNEVTNIIIDDLIQGRITPEEAAKKLEREGNALIKKLGAI